MKYIFSLLIMLIFFSCKKKDEISLEELLGKWGIIEVLVVQGDGSAIFQPVASEKEVEFKTNGILESTGSLCAPFLIENITNGTYNMANSTITTSCTDPNIARIDFEIIDDYLVLSFIANEGYAHKYEKK